MGSNNVLMRALYICSPVLVATIVSVVFTASTIISPQDKATDIRLTTNPPPTTAPAKTVTQISAVTAVGIYTEFQSNEKGASAKYLNKGLIIKGKVIGWGKRTTSDWVTLDEAGGTGLVVCQLPLGFVLVEHMMDNVVGTVIDISGICSGLNGNQLIITECYSESLPIFNPSTTE